MLKKVAFKKLIISLIIFSVLFSMSAFAHSGGLDNLGGHNVRTTGHGYEVGTYHYHKGTYAGWIVDNKGDIPHGESIFDISLITDTVDISKASDWAVLELNQAYKIGLLKGVKNTFSSKFQADITRAEFCKIIINYIQVHNPSFQNDMLRDNCYFNDLGQYGNEIINAYKIGIVNGFSNTEFKPNEKITREQIACMLYRYLYRFTDVEINNRNIPIVDADDIANWANLEVHGLVSAGVIKGTSNIENSVVFSPKANTTIEQALLLVYRMYNL